MPLNCSLVLSCLTYGFVTFHRTQGLSMLPALRSGRSPVASSASPVGADGRPTQLARPALRPTDVNSLPPMPALPRMSRTSLGDSQRRQRSGRRRSSVQGAPRSCWGRLKQRMRRFTGTTSRASVAGSMGQRGSPGTSKSTTPNAGSGLSRHIDPSRIASFRSKGSLASLDRPEATMSGADLKAQRKHSLPGMYATTVVQTGWSARPVRLLLWCVSEKESSCNRFTMMRPKERVKNCWPAHPNSTCPVEVKWLLAPLRLMIQRLWFAIALGDNTDQSIVEHVS